MAIIHACPLPSGNLPAYCGRLFELIAPRLADADLEYLRGISAAQALASCLIGRGLALLALPRSGILQIRQPGAPWAPRQIALSHGKNIAFCAASANGIAIDAAAPLGRCGAAAAKQMLSRIQPRLRSCAAKAERLLCVCEALLKLTGYGFSAEAWDALESAPLQRRQGTTSWRGQMLAWRSQPFAGHWIAIAADGEAPPLEFRLIEPALLLRAHA